MSTIYPNNHDQVPFHIKTYKSNYSMMGKMVLTIFVYYMESDYFVNSKRGELFH